MKGAKVQRSAAFFAVYGRTFIKAETGELLDVGPCVVLVRWGKVITERLPLAYVELFDEDM